MVRSLKIPAAGRWALASAVALFLAATTSFSAPEKKNEGTSGKDGAKARAIAASLKTLDTAVKQKSSVAKPPPSVKTITPPTITPARIDALMEKHLAGSKVPLAPATTDIEFVRRAHLDLTGKLPTPEQVRNFCQTKGQDKRAKLVEYLMNTEDYATNWGHYWRDVIKFRATNANGNQIRYNELEGWLARQFAANKPWDEIAKGLITASGRNDEENAAGFWIAHEAQAPEMAGEVSRVFMGIQIQCAQCHDHPNDSWKREQFHQFAAFFAGARIRKVGDGKGANRVDELVALGKPRYTYPDKADPQKQVPIDPQFFLDPKAKPLSPGLTAQERIETAAALITDQNNPWFAKAFVNRVWYLLMGEGFYLPVDDMGPEREAKAGVVLDALATQWAGGGYDVKWLLRTIMNTQTYQREIRSTYSETGKVAFASNSPSRLRADQILDSLHQVLGLPTGDGGGGEAAKGKNAGAALAKDLKGAAGKMKGMRGGGGARMLFDALYGYDPSTPYDEVLGTIPQALFLMNSPQVNNAMKANPNAVLGRILHATPDNRAALHQLYLQVLAREPTAQEQKVLRNYIDKVGDRAEAFEDILWSLINSTEFVTRR